MASASVAVVSLTGEHDLGGYEPLRTGVARAAIRGAHVIVDLSACDFIDSTVISILLHTETIIASDGGRLVVALPAEDNAVTRGGAHQACGDAPDLRILRRGTRQLPASRGSRCCSGVTSQARP